MKRALCIWLPHWPLQRLAAARAELNQQAVVLYKLHGSTTARVVAYCPRLATAAAALWETVEDQSATHETCPRCVRRAPGLRGIRPGMPLAEATALWQGETGQNNTNPTRKRGSETARSATPPSLARRVDESSDIFAKREHGTRREQGRQLHLEMADPLGDRLALEELAAWCQRFSPTVGLEEAAQPESLLLDVTGLGPLAGGERALAGEVVAAFRERGLAVRVAIADTLSAAWAVAHFAEVEWAGEDGAARRDSGAAGEAAILAALRVPLVVAEGQSPAALAALPVEALRLPPQTCERLAELGLRRIDELAALARATLLARFGPQVLLQLDRARGAAREALVACRPPAAWEFEWPFAYATARGEMIEYALGELVGRACGALARERLGVLRLACRFDYEHSSIERIPAERFVVGLYRPNANPRHVYELVRLRLARLRLRGPVAGLRLTVLAADRLEFHQQEMFVEDPGAPGRDAPRELAALVDRLGNRLGARAVVRPWLLAEAQPEFACQYQPLASPATRPVGKRPRRRKKQHWQDASATRDAQRGEPRGFGDRPIHLEPRPRPLEVVSVAPEGPPMKFRLSGRDERVVRVWGPERIETGWWRARLVRRDYYQVETARGARYWLFRELAGGGWFLHGEFA